MTVDEFLAWSEGRFELENGEVISMSPQHAGHALTERRCSYRLLRLSPKQPGGNAGR